MESKRVRYVKISVPEELAKMIDKVGKKYAYRSKAEFVVEAVREKLQRLGVLQGRSE